MRMDFNAPKFSGEPLETHQARFDNYAHLATFMFAGNATITLRSIKTQTRFTYRIKKVPEDSEGPVGYFVAVLTGPQNTNDFTYLGHIYKSTRDYTHGRKSKIGIEAPSSAAWEWFYNCAFSIESLRPETVEIWHEGRCGRCNRKLTVPESIASGIGPECAKHV